MFRYPSFGKEVTIAAGGPSVKRLLRAEGLSAEPSGLCEDRKMGTAPPAVPIISTPGPASFSCTLRLWTRHPGGRRSKVWADRHMPLLLYSRSAPVYLRQPPLAVSSSHGHLLRLRGQPDRRTHPPDTGPFVGIKKAATAFARITDPRIGSELSETTRLVVDQDGCKGHAEPAAEGTSRDHGRPNSFGDIEIQKEENPRGLCTSNSTPVALMQRLDPSERPGTDQVKTRPGAQFPQM